MGNLWLSSRLNCCSSWVDKVVDVPGVAYGGFWKNFLFCVLLPLFTWEPRHCLFELVVSGSHLSPCIATINGSFSPKYLRFSS